MYMLRIMYPDNSLLSSLNVGRNEIITNKVQEIHFLFSIFHSTRTGPTDAIRSWSPDRRGRREIVRQSGRENVNYHWLVL